MSRKYDLKCQCCLSWYLFCCWGHALGMAPLQPGRAATDDPVWWPTVGLEPGEDIILAGCCHHGGPGQLPRTYSPTLMQKVLLLQSTSTHTWRRGEVHVASKSAVPAADCCSALLHVEWHHGNFHVSIVHHSHSTHLCSTGWSSKLQKSILGKIIIYS